eukprot:Skav227904  [mRNA]  locus=scaffold146:39831:44239:+ [translate_table: standard]
MDEKTEGRQDVASDVSEVRYSLKDPLKFAGFLQDADVRLIRAKSFADLLVSKQPLPRRQEAESQTFTYDGQTQTALVTHEEVERWAKGDRNAIICSISHAWETREHPDPCRYQLQQIVNQTSLFEAGFQAEVWIFYDYVSLFQYERDPGHQQCCIGRAMQNMHIMYSHECSMTLRIESLTPEDVWEATKRNEKELISVFDADSKRIMAKPLKDLVENRNKYLERGWCMAEIEWSSLRRVNLQHRRIDGTDSEEDKSDLSSRMPMTPANFREKMERAKFTHRSDSESVIQLQEKIFYEKVTTCECLVLESLPASQILALADALPLYGNLKNLKMTKYQCNEEEASAFGTALAATSVRKLEVLSPEGESVRFMGKAIALALSSNNSIRDVSLQGNVAYPGSSFEAAQALAKVLKVNKSVQKLDLMCIEIGPGGAKAVAETLKVNKSLTEINMEANQIEADGAKSIAEAECYLETINTRLGRNRSPEAKSPDALRREPTAMSESDGIDYDLILKIMEEIETSPDGAWTFAPESMRSIPKDRGLEVFS